MDTTFPIAAFDQVLEAFAAAPAGEGLPTSLQIGGYPHYENVLSNYLDFFLNTERPHGLGAILTQALAEAADHAMPGAGFDRFRETGSVECEREYPVGGSGGRDLRIDLLLRAAEGTIVVEHKVFAPLTNDLGAYLAGVRSDDADEPEPLGIVLAPHRGTHVLVSEQARYATVTYAELLEALQPRLGAALMSNSVNHRYLAILQEVLRTMSDMKTTSATEADRRAYYEKYAQKIDAVFADARDMQTVVRRRARSVGAALTSQRQDLVERSTNGSLFQYQPSTEVIAKANLDYQMDGWRLAIDVVAAPAETYFELFERGANDGAVASRRVEPRATSAGLEIEAQGDKFRVMGSSFSHEAGPVHEDMAAEAARIIDAMVGA